MNRTPFVGGNWKMNTDLESGLALLQSLSDQIGPSSPSSEVVVYPPFPYLMSLHQTMAQTIISVRLGAQNVSDQPNGAFTGEVSTEMLLDCGVRSVLVGHSERRHVIGECDALINAKTRRGLEAGLQVVLCVGETLEQREAGETDTINERQIRAGLQDVSAEAMSEVVIAYEPVWAIGTGRTASPDDAQKAHAHIRAVLSSLYDDRLAGQVRVIYGGSVKSSNAAELFSCPDIDGGLIGGASLKAEEFAKIIRATG